MPGQTIEVRRTIVQHVKPWSLIGYRHHGSTSLHSRVLRLDLPDVQSLNTASRELVAFVRRDGRRRMEVFSGFLSGSTSDQSKSVQMNVRTFPLEADFDVTDVTWSSSTFNHYILDASRRQLIVASRLGESITLQALSLNLPADVTLGPGSRIAVMERDPERPEVLDSTIFISAPGSNVVLSVDPETGVASVFAGQPKQSGVTVGRPAAGAARFTHPSGVALDMNCPVPRLLIADMGTDDMYGVDLESREVDVIVSAHTRHRASSPVHIGALNGPIGMFVYRLASFQVDDEMLERSRAQLSTGWGDVPALMICWDATYKIIVVPLNLRGEPVVAAGLGGLRTVRPLPSGELIAIGASVWHVQHPFALAAPMSGMRNASSPATLE